MSDVKVNATRPQYSSLMGSATSVPIIFDVPETDDNSHLEKSSTPLLAFAVTNVTLELIDEGFTTRWKQMGPFLKATKFREITPVAGHNYIIAISSFLSEDSQDGTKSDPLQASQKPDLNHKQGALEIWEDSSESRMIYRLNINKTKITTVSGLEKHDSDAGLSIHMASTVFPYGYEYLEFRMGLQPLTTNLNVKGSVDGEASFASDDQIEYNPTSLGRWKCMMPKGSLAESDSKHPTWLGDNLLRLGSNVGEPTDLDMEDEELRYGQPQRLTKKPCYDWLKTKLRCLGYFQSLTLYSFVSRSEAPFESIKPSSLIKGIPKNSRSIIWAKQIDRQLFSYMMRVKDKYAEGFNNFIKKLDIKLIFDLWVKDWNKQDMSITSSMFEIQQSWSTDVYSLAVAFNADVIVIFKEDGKKGYSSAVNLIESLRLNINQENFVGSIMDPGGPRGSLSLRIPLGGGSDFGVGRPVNFVHLVRKQMPSHSQKEHFT
ncbi:hypothetical protein BY996DRAFT_6574753 [Phakopsora pachyrhizi]|nr:hypothetical protein BY996DRAFT_6574753 [Phakopsora pachyrhizi]